MKPLNLDKVSDAEIEDALTAVNGMRVKHTVTSTFRVHALKDRFIQLLNEQGVTTTERAGAQLKYRGGGAAAMSYKYGRTVSTLTFRVGSDGRAVFLAAIGIDKAFPRQNAVMKIELKETGYNSWLQKQADKFGIVRKNSVAKPDQAPVTPQ
ncbi:MAG: hypothetical protein ABSF67_01395 [Roseiarcus sp.]|jgi:hypothetical protein